MKLSNFLYRCLATLVLLATLLTVAPSVFASAEENTEKVTRAVTPVQNDNINLSNKKILAFYIDPAFFTPTDAKIDALTARGVTDFYVLTKDYEGDLDTSLLTDVISYASSSVRVHAWIYAGRDDTYLASNPTHSQYHFRVGNKCNAHDSSSSYYDSRNGFVDLSQSAYITYFNKQINTLEAVSGIDGIVVDLARYGAEYYGFGPELKAKVTKAEYNELAKALCAHHGYTYNTNGTIDGTSGYYTFSGTTTADYKSFTALLNANGTAAQKYIAHRTDVIKNFLSKVKSNCAIPLGAIVQPEVVSYSADGNYPRCNYGIGLYGQDPAKLPSVTDYVAINSFMGDYWAHAGSAYRTNYASNCAIAFAKMGCNVVAGIQGDAFSNDDEVYSSTNTSARGTDCYSTGAELRAQAEYLNDARRLINGDPTIGGDILGAVVREAGSTAMARVTYSGGVFTINIVAGATAISEIQIRLNNSLYAKTTATSYTYNSQTWKASGTVSSGGYYPRLTANISVAAYGTKTLKIQACTATGGTPSLSHDNIHPVSVLVWNSTTNNNSTVRSIYIDSHIGSAHTSCSFTKTTPLAATCSAAGYNLYTCSTCGYDYAEYVAKNANAHVAVTDPAVAATCSTTGLTEGSHCSLCNAVIKAQTATEKLPHTEVSTPDVPATCTTPGSTGGKHCSVCNTVIVAPQVVPVIGHDAVIVPAIAPSCESAGLTEGSYCLTCGEILVPQQTVDALGHDYAAKLTAPTCNAQGYTTFTCENCNHSYKGEYTAKLEHDYSAVTTPATCLAPGYTTFTCELCGHSYNSDYTEITDHDYIAEVTPPTCSQQGYSTFTCTLCGDSYIDDYTPTTAHNYVVVVHAPTCNSIGYTSYDCACGDSYASDYLPALSHSFIYTDNGEGHTITCKNCDYSANEDHLIAGVHCTLCYAFICDHSKTTTIVDVEATCTTEGSSHVECTICSKTLSTEIIAALGHEVVYYPTKNPTCDQPGNRAYYQCTNCKAYYADAACTYPLPDTFVYIAAKGHSYVDTVIEPTCTAEGYTMHTCSVCLDTYQGDYVAALGHNYAYTNNGANHTATCSKCSHNATEDHSYKGGVCACGALADTNPTLDTSLKFNMNIAIGAEMVVNYNFAAGAVSKYDSFYLEIKKDVAGGSPVTTTYGISAGHTALGVMNHPTTGEPVLYNASYTGINAKEMGDKFATTLYAIDANGNVFRGETVISSIKDFLISKLEDNSAIPELKTMAVDMLKYGAAAQINFNYDPANLVTNDLTAQQLALATQGTPTANDYSTVIGTGSNVNTSITVGSKVELSLSSIIRDVADPSAVKCVIIDNKGTVLAELNTSNMADIMYSAKYDNVGAREMRKVITATFFDGNGAPVSKTLRWSVESYVAQTRVNAKASANEIALVNALLTYGDSVAAYLDASGL